MRTPRALIAATGALVLMLSAACTTSEPEEQTTSPGSEAIIEVPGEDGGNGEEPDDDGGQADGGADPGHHESDTGTDMHDHTHGDLDDAPGVAELDEIHQMAGDFWVANTERRWDHPDGPAQVLEQIRPHVTDRYYDHRAELLEGSGREVWWVEWAHDERVTDAAVRQATFQPDQPFTADRVLVRVEGAVVDNSPRQNRHLADADSVYAMVELERTDQGWKVDDFHP
ncbi:hypothetical protein [Pseudactinotalea sp. Z1748]|uniref:hypothetical protein n=1 Tax=Pseudactinotalea sp. Z1748 TaxID=3413027 RepID=UPI003C7E2521